MTRHLCNIGLFAVWLALSSLMQGKARADGPIEIGSRLELLLDDYLIGSVRNLSFQLHPPQWAEKVLEPEKPWEGDTLGHVTVFRDGDLFRMYYRGYIKPPGYSWEPDQLMCYAESRDGIRWTRPSLGLFEWGGSKDNNIVLWGPDAGTLAPFRDSSPGCAPESLYKALGGNPPYAMASPDGLHWRRLADKPVLPQQRFGLSYWDPSRKSYVAYVRSRLAERRSIALSKSSDYLKWSEPENLDFGNTPPEEFYWNTSLPYFRAPHIYLGYPMRLIFYTDPGTGKRTDRTDHVLLISRDGFNMDRRFMETFVRPGLDPRNWESHTNMMALGILETGENELSMYLTNKAGGGAPHLRRLVLRTDGFVSLRAPFSGGEFTTRPLVFSGNQLVLNISTGAAGSVKVEIQSAEGAPLSGFRLEDCPEYFGDSTAAVFRFAKGSDLGALAGKPVRLRFVLRDADLYALSFRQGKDLPRNRD